MSKETLEIIQGLSQAAANAWDGAHTENHSLDGQVRKVGLKREEGIPLLDKRVNDGFKVKFYADSLVISYQSDVSMKEVKGKEFQSDINEMLKSIKNFLEKEYKAVTGKSVSLKEKGESDIFVQSTSNVRTFVTAKQHYKISGLEMEQIGEPSKDITKDITRKFLETAKANRPENEFIKASDNQKQ